MRNLMLGAGILGLGASICLGGCLGGDEDSIGVPQTDPVSEAEATLGVAPRGDMFAPSALRGRQIPAALNTVGEDKDPGVVSSVRATFDPAAFQQSASFRAKLLEAK